MENMELNSLLYLGDESHSVKNYIKYNSLLYGDNEDISAWQEVFALATPNHKSPSKKITISLSKSPVKAKIEKPRCRTPSRIKTIIFNNSKDIQFKLKSAVIPTPKANPTHKSSESMPDSRRMMIQAYRRSKMIIYKQLHRKPAYEFEDSLQKSLRICSLTPEKKDRSSIRLPIYPQNFFIRNRNRLNSAKIRILKGSLYKP